MSDTRPADVTLDAWQNDPAIRVRAWAGLTVAAASIFLFVLDSGLVGFALPVIREEHPEYPLATISWAATGFLVAVASLLLIGGRLTDRYGRKRVYLAGLFGFGVGSVLTALAPTVPLLIAARIVQGGLGALLTSSALALVMPLFPAERHGVMVGTWASIGSIASILAPTLGPYLIAVSWRFPFALVGPLCWIVGVVGHRVLREQSDPAAKARIDPLSLAIGPVALGLLTLTLSRGRVWGWGSRPFAVGLLAALTLLVAFVLRCRRVASPLVDFSHFRSAGFRGYALAGGFQQVGFFTWWVTAPLIVGAVWGWSGQKTGVAIALGQVCAAISGPVGGRWSDRLGNAAIPTVTGALVVILGAGYLFAGASVAPRFWSVFVPATMLMGLGGGVCGALTTGAALRELPSTALGSANSLLQLIRRVAGTLGIAIATAVVGEAEGASALARARVVWVIMATSHAVMCLCLVGVRKRSRFAATST